MTDDREPYGRIARETWVAWAKEQPDVADHPSWTVDWDGLPDRDREVDMRIGAAVAAAEKKQAEYWHKRWLAAMERADEDGTQAISQHVRIQDLSRQSEAAEARLAEIRQVIKTYFVVHGNSTSASLTHARDLAEGIRQILDRKPAP